MATTIRIAEADRPRRSADEIDPVVGGVYPIRSLEQTSSRARSFSRDARSQQPDRDEKLEDDEDSQGDLRQAGDFKQKQVWRHGESCLVLALMGIRSLLANCFSTWHIRALV